jgi:hypothetical protein
LRNLVRWLIRLQSVSFVVTLAVPAYVAATRTMAHLGVGLAWYHHAGLMAASLSSAAVVTAMIGLVLIVIAWFGEKSLGRTGEHQELGDRDQSDTAR